MAEDEFNPFEALSRLWTSRNRVRIPVLLGIVFAWVLILWLPLVLPTGTPNWVIGCLGLVGALASACVAIGVLIGLFLLLRERSAYLWAPAAVLGVLTWVALLVVFYSIPESAPSWVKTPLLGLGFLSWAVAIGLVFAAIYFPFKLLYDRTEHFKLLRFSWATADHILGLLFGALVGLLGVGLFVLITMGIQYFSGRGAGGTGILRCAGGWLALLLGLALLGLTIAGIVRLVTGKWYGNEPEPAPLRKTPLLQSVLGLLLLLLAFPLLAVAGEGLQQFDELSRAHDRTMASMYREIYAGRPDYSTEPTPMAWFQSQGGVDGWRAEIIAVGLAFGGGVVVFCMLVFCTAGVSKVFREKDKEIDLIYERLGIRFAAVALVAGCVLGYLAYTFFCKPGVQLYTDISVRWEQQALLVQCKKDYDKHYDDVLKGVLVPNRTATEFAAKLRRINTADCSPEFKAAFDEYVRAWNDLGSFIENNSGLPGIVEAYKTGGLSLLDAWLRVVPDKVAAIKKADDDMERIARMKRE